MRISKPISEISHKLFEIANNQMGYFTTKQAVSVGVPDSSHSYHLKAGNWKREMRGIYRLTDYPISEHEELMVWFLWARNREGVPQGVFSHDTALDIYELSDINPSKIHLTVPKNFQRFNTIPKQICIHKYVLDGNDVKGFYGMKITTPIRTIVDLVSEGKIASDFIRQAIRQGQQKGLINQKQLDNYPEIAEYMKK